MTQKIKVNGIFRAKTTLPYETSIGFGMGSVRIDILDRKGDPLRNVYLKENVGKIGIYCDKDSIVFNIFSDQVKDKPFIMMVKNNIDIIDSSQISQLIKTGLEDVTINIGSSSFLSRIGRE